MAETSDSRLPAPFNKSTESFELIAQGAESLLYRTTFLSSSQPAALKVRPEKKWRHPTLDKRLTRARILAEARVLVKLSGEGVVAGGGGRKVKDPKKGDVGVGGMRGCVPKVLGLDWEQGWMITEWIEGKTVKEAIYGASKVQVVDDEKTAEELKVLLRNMGEVVGKLHACGVVHGDLTTSNMMLRPRASTSDAVTGCLDGDILLIDFGLATQSHSDEDRAVDLYVLERAFGSTHPKEEDLFGTVLEAYANGDVSGMKGKAGKVAVRRLEDVRMRGRKKSMLG
ncbi:serine/threonine-protein kinase bud32 [Elasticomyces elasticus]|nr:serine/threonine-protein kinase bud32 [Elasticomyces elasticus]